MGDFFRINLPQSFVQPWDTWLQQGIHAVRGELGPNWQNCFMSAPIWRFTLAAGVAGPSAMLGVLMPSVDRVGRQFPLTIATPLSRSSDIPLTHFSVAATFEHLETLALGSLEDGFSREMLSHRMAGIPRLGIPLSGRQSTNTSTACVISQNPIANLAAEAARTRPNAAIWSAELDRTSPLMMTNSLPTTSQMRGLFDLQAPVWATDQTTEQGARI